MLYERNTELKVFGDGRDTERELARLMLDNQSFKSIMIENELTQEEALAHLIRLGLINTEFYETITYDLIEDSD